MCDQANHNNCEIIDDLHLTITNLEMTIADLRTDFVNDLKEIVEECWQARHFLEKWEAK